MELSGFAIRIDLNLIGMKNRKFDSVYINQVGAVYFQKTLHKL